MVCNCTDNYLQNAMYFHDPLYAIITFNPFHAICMIDNAEPYASGQQVSFASVGDCVLSIHSRLRKDVDLVLIQGENC